jgi:hypothetical protein
VLNAARIREFAHALSGYIDLLLCPTAVGATLDSCDEHHPGYFLTRPLTPATKSVANISVKTLNKPPRLRTAFELPSTLRKKKQ